LRRTSGFVGSLLRVALVIIPKGVLGHPDGPLRRHPKGHAKPRVAPLGQLLPLPELPSLTLGEIQAAVLQELPMMPKPAQIAALSEEVPTATASSPSPQPVLPGT
jgi:hypothetical protein